MSIDDRRRRSKKRPKQPPKRRPNQVRRSAPPTPDESRLHIMALLSVVVDLLVANPEHAARFAEVLTKAGAGAEWLRTRLGSAVDVLIDMRTAEGWTPADLARVALRRADGRTEAVVVGGLRRQAAAAGSDGLHPLWQAELDDLPAGADPDLATVEGLRDVLLVIAALRGLPALPQPVPPPRHRSAPVSTVGHVSLTNMTNSYNVAEAKAQLSRLLDAALAGDEVVIARAGRPLVRLVPVTAPAARELGFVPMNLPDELFAPLDEAELAGWS